MLSFFPRDVLDEILNLIGSVSEGFPTYSLRSETVLSNMASWESSLLADQYLCGLQVSEETVIFCGNERLNSFKVGSWSFKSIIILLIYFLNCRRALFTK